MITTKSILSSLSELDQIELNTECDVLSSLTDSYMKSIHILEHYEGNDLSVFSIFMEDGDNNQQQQSSNDEDNRSVWQKAAGNKNENIVFRILAYIPRLLKEFWKWLTKEENKNPPETQEKKKKALKTFGERLDEMSESEIDELELKMNEDLPEGTSIKIDRDTHQISFKNVKGALDSIDDLMGIGKNIWNIGESIKKEPENIQKILDEINAVKTGEKPMSANAIFMSTDEIGNVSDKANALNKNLTAGIGVIGSYFDNLAKSSEASGRDDKFAESISNASKKLLGIQNTVVSALSPITGFMSHVLKWVGLAKGANIMHEDYMAMVGKQIGFRDIDINFVKYVLLQKDVDKLNAEYNQQRENIKQLNELMSKIESGQDSSDPEKTAQNITIATFIAKYDQRLLTIIKKMRDNHETWNDFKNKSEMSAYDENAVWGAYCRHIMEWICSWWSSTFNETIDPNTGEGFNDTIDGNFFGKGTHTDAEYNNWKKIKVEEWIRNRKLAADPNYNKGNIELFGKVIGGSVGQFFSNMTDSLKRRELSATSWDSTHNYKRNI